MSPEEFKVQQLTKQIGQMAQDHAAATAELHLQYTITIQSLQAEIEQLKAVDQPESDPEIEAANNGD